MLTSPTSVKFAIVWYQNQHLYFADVSVGRLKKNNNKKVRTFLKLHVLLFLRIAGPSVLFITLEYSTSAVECVALFVTDA